MQRPGRPLQSSGIVTPGTDSGRESAHSASACSYGTTAREVLPTIRIAFVADTDCNAQIGRMDTDRLHWYSNRMKTIRAKAAAHSGVTNGTNGADRRSGHGVVHDHHTGPDFEIDRGDGRGNYFLFRRVHCLVRIRGDCGHDSCSGRRP